MQQLVQRRETDTDCHTELVGGVGSHVKMKRTALPGVQVVCAMTSVTSVDRSGVCSGRPSTQLGATHASGFQAIEPLVRFRDESECELETAAASPTSSIWILMVTSAPAAALTCKTAR